MKIFVGIPLSQDLQEKIVGWQKLYKETYASEGIRWMQKKNLHVTMIPPWQVEDPQEIIEKLQEISFPTAPWSISFEKIITAPHRKPKYIWAEGHAPKELLLLRRELAEVLERASEKRAFLLHSTIARIKKYTDVTPFIENIHWSMEVNAYTLFQSILTEEGTDYETLATIPLKR